MKKAIFGFSVRDITEIAIFCALAVLLDTFLKIPLGETGGSLNFAMLPLYIIALRHGPFKGFIAGGIVFGLITCLIDGYGFASFPLEYLVAFGSVGILGFYGRDINKWLNATEKKGLNITLVYSVIVACVAIAAVVRFFCGSIDSVLLWEYEWSAAYAYNAVYVFPSAAAVLVLLAILTPFVKNVNKMFPTTYLKGSDK